MTQCVVSISPKGSCIYSATGQMQYQCLHSCSAVQQPHQHCIQNPCPVWFFQLHHTPERMEGVIYLHFRCYPKQGGINGRHRHNPGDMKSGTQQRFQLWPGESPFAMWQRGYTSAHMVTVLTTVSTSVSIYLRSGSWTPKAGSSHGKTGRRDTDQDPKDQVWHTRQNDGNRNQVGTEKYFPENIKKTPPPSSCW